ncbi:hypothetical protein N2K95_15460 [Arthrobacter zhaoxinii]|uniref:DNA-binding protein n=1 Tax=Arthrobacter zhaoxinii TaxID=2964616 RepID=A0ABY5YS09_9MICC|nr:hypothetical protein [Arthrobacter zhaoxinii]MCQ2000032.1 hypothetical protein [Arthrobacter zhaoxinii]UWX97006.1 hypothetical protein N2K95_15460 [Arthrobacter zhaoxinii]
MADHEEVVVADSQELGSVLGCSEDVLADLKNSGVLASNGEAWNVGPAREYLRDAAWADEVWF